MLSFFVYSNPKMNTSSTRVLMQQLETLENHITNSQLSDTGISKVSVAWHLDHSLKTINGICEALSESNPEDYSWAANVARSMSLTLNFIPRGRAQSPASVLPPGTIFESNLYNQLEQARTKIQKAVKLDNNANFEHPVFGQMNKSETLRFLEVHTNHHLKIVTDIMKSAISNSQLKLQSSYE